MGFPVLKSLKMMADSKDPIQSVQTFGRKKTATAVAYCKRGKGLIRVNGKPLTEVEPRALQHKLTEPVQLLGQDRFADVGLLRSTPSDRLCPRPSSLTIKSMLTSKARRQSRIPLFSTTVACW